MKNQKGPGTFRLFCTFTQNYFFRKFVYNLSKYIFFNVYFKTYKVQKCEQFITLQNNIEAIEEFILINKTSTTKVPAQQNITYFENKL